MKCLCFRDIVKHSPNLYTTIYYLHMLITTLLFLNPLRSELTLSEKNIMSQNLEIFNRLKKLSETNEFSKLKMSFNDKCPRAVEKCSLNSCTIPGMKVGEKDGSFDLLKIQESYSKGLRNSFLVWKDIYERVRDNSVLERLVSGLHFSITTHIANFHTKIFNTYFSHPLIFQSKYNEKFEHNLFFLYNIVRLAVANLHTNTGALSKETLQFSKFLRNLIAKERLELAMRLETYKNTNDQQITFNQDNSRKITLDELSDLIVDENFSSVLNELPKIEKDAIEATNDIVRRISCLECDKCKLLGTIQVKGMKAAIKSLNNVPLYKNEAIFLINLFRRLSISVKESQKLKNIQFPHFNLIFICHREISVILMTLLIMTLCYLKISRRRRNKFN